MKDVWTSIEESPKVKKINKKKVALIILIVILLIAVVTVTIVYKTNKSTREWIDKNIFRKEVMQDKATIIEIKENSTGSIYAFNKYIGILDKMKLKIYNAAGNVENELEMQISNPIFTSENRFLAVSENKGKKLYLIEDKDIAWEDNVDGNISQIYVNKNGYVAVVIVDTSYKNAIKMYSPQGDPLFTFFFSSKRTVDVSISNDNKYMAIAELDTSGTAVQSSIKIMSVEKAKKEENALEKTYQSEAGKLITNIKYQDRNRLVCMYTDSIYEIEGEEQKCLLENNKKVTFQSIELANYACAVEEKSSGLFTADSLVKLINIENKNIKEYTADTVTKEIYTYGDIIALNLGTEVEFINTSGWLAKRYIANQEITNIVVSSSLAGIIYRDKIEIVNF